MYGGIGNDVIDGGVGNDTMQGGAGNDTYVYATGDTIIEAANEGFDTVNSWNSYTLGANIERVLLLGSANTQAIGNALANVLLGNAGNNILDGGAGHDTMQGGAGNDTYVYATGDTIVEGTNAGIDTVNSWNSYTLGANIERVLLLGSANTQAIGNNLNNEIIGNSGNNLLDGGAGSDTMQGGAGNDTYVYATGDTIVEGTNAGIDTVNSWNSYTLGANIERVLLLGSANTQAIGNNLNNELIGNSGNNLLDGGAGSDTMQGGAGNDTYVYATGDTIIEGTNSGIDTVNSWNSYTLGANIERALLLGSANTQAIGNALDNELIGNSGANLLNGALGNDTLTGNGGADRFYFSTALNTATNVDIITDFVQGTDTIQLENGIFTQLTTTGALNANWLQVGNAALDADDFLIYDSITGDLYYDEDGNGTDAAILFAHLGTSLHPTLAASDFLVV